VKHVLSLLVILFITQTIIAQEYGSKFRKEYEKEKNGPHGECAVDWMILQPGLEYRTIHCLGDEDDLDLHVVRVDLDRWDLDAAFVDRATGRMIARDNKASFAMNANFFDRARNPIGVVVRTGSLVNAPNKSSWQSIFLVDDDGTPRVIMPSKWSKYKNHTQMAVQAGPRLVIAGHTNKSLKNNYTAARGGVCINRDGDVMFFATPQDRKFHITEIARVARRDEIDGGLACRDAMLFDGGHSVNFFASGEQKRINVEGDPVPVLVYATPHHEIATTQTK
jgi:uncharacterized protein YigE (DUF2233 family)